MIEVFTLKNFGTLLMLRFLQAVLGFDKKLYISIESQRAPVRNKIGQVLGYYSGGCVACSPAFYDDLPD